MIGQWWTWWSLFHPWLDQIGKITGYWISIQLNSYGTTSPCIFITASSVLSLSLCIIHGCINALWTETEHVCAHEYLIFYESQSPTVGASAIVSASAAPGDAIIHLWGCARRPPSLPAAPTPLRLPGPLPSRRQWPCQGGSVSFKGRMHFPSHHYRNGALAFSLPDLGDGSSRPVLRRAPHGLRFQDGFEQTRLYQAIC